MATILYESLTGLYGLAYHFAHVSLRPIKLPIRELKQRRRRHRGRRQVKNEFILYQRNLRLSSSVQFQMEIRKISRRRPRSVGDTELGHFTFLFCRGRQRNVQRFITHVQSYCFAH